MVTPQMAEKKEAALIRVEPEPTSPPGMDWALQGQQKWHLKELAKEGACRGEKKRTPIFRKERRWFPVCTGQGTAWEHLEKKASIASSLKFSLLMAGRMTCL